MPRGAGRIGWYLVWAVAFGSVASSMYFVPGLLLQAAGSGGAGLVGALSIAFLGLVAKEAELTRRHPYGGGGVSQVRETFGETTATIAGLLLLVDLSLTVAVSVEAAAEQVGGLGVPLALAALVVIVVVNVVGVRGIVVVGLVMGLAALGLNGLVLVSVAVNGGSTPEPLSLGMWSHSALGLGWLAFSGIEVCALLSPAMKEWGSTPTRALTALGVAVLATGPLLMWFTAGLPHDALRAAHTHLLPELARRTGGPVLGTAVAVAGGGLLLFAAHAALTASFQVQAVLVSLRAWPSPFVALSSRFQTPITAMCVVGLFAATLLVATSGDIRTLGLLYGAAFTLSVGLGSAALDVQLWRQGVRGPLLFLGVGVTGLLFAGGVGILVSEPWTAAVIGGAVIAGLAVGRLVRSGRMASGFAKIPGFAQPMSPSGRDLPFLTIAQARQDRQPSAPAGILVASRGADPRVFREAVDRARSRGLTRVHVIYVDEVPGLLYPQQGQPTAEGLLVLESSCRTIVQLGLQPVALWAMSHSAARSVAEAVVACGCDTVIIGATQRTVVWQALRGRFIHDLKQAVPVEVRITVVG